MYPTMKAVDKATHLELCRWYRFLPGPGMSAVGKPDFEETLTREKKILDKIVDRVVNEKAMTPKISKDLGWGD